MFLDILLFFLDLLLGFKLHFLLSNLGIYSTFSCFDILDTVFELNTDQISLLMRFFDYFKVDFEQIHGFTHEVPLLGDGLKIGLPLLINFLLSEFEVIALLC
jgi:hypothetical protein